MKPSRSAAIVLTAGLAFAACGDTTTTDANTEGAAVTTTLAGGSDTATAGSNGESGGTQYPLTVDNCGEQVTIPARPENVLLTSLFGPVGYVEAAGAFDQVTTIVSGFSTPEYTLKEQPGALAFVNSLEQIGPEGGTEDVSLEQIIDAEPDLVIGSETNSVTRTGLADVGIPMLILPGLCGDGHTAVLQSLDMDFILDQVEFWGEIFDQPEAAAASVEDLQARLDAVEEAAADAPQGRTAGTVYACVDGSCFGVYGTSSTAHPMLLAAGFENVFDDFDGRYNETTIEELITRDPEFIVILGGEQSDDQVLIDHFTSLPGVSGLQAVVNDNILVIPFSDTDPPNPYSIDGLEAIVEAFD